LLSQKKKKGHKVWVAGGPIVHKKEKERGARPPSTKDGFGRKRGDSGLRRDTGLGCPGRKRGKKKMRVRTSPEGRGDLGERKVQK